MSLISDNISYNAFAVFSAGLYGAACASKFGISSIQGAAYGMICETFSCIGSEAGQRLCEKNKQLKASASEHIIDTSENNEFYDVTVFGHTVKLSAENVDKLKNTVYKCSGAAAGTLTGAVVVKVIDSSLPLSQCLKLSLGAAFFGLANKHTIEMVYGAYLKS